MRKIPKPDKPIQKPSHDFSINLLLYRILDSKPRKLLRGLVSLFATSHPFFRSTPLPTPITLFHLMSSRTCRRLLFLDKPILLSCTRRALDLTLRLHGLRLISLEFIRNVGFLWAYGWFGSHPFRDVTFGVVGLERGRFIVF